MNLKIKSNDIVDWIFYLIILLVLIVSGSVYGLKYGGTLFIPILVFLGTFLLILKIGSRVNAWPVYFAIIFIAFILHYVIVFYFNDLVIFVKFLIRLIGAFLIIFLYRIYNRSLRDDLYKVLYLLVIHSLLNFIVVNALGNSASYSIFETELNNYRTYHNIFFFQPPILLNNIKFFRNYGMFWEPGVLALYMSVFMLIAIFIKKNTFASILGIFVLLTTFSTLGYILLVLILFFKFKENISAKKGIVIFLVLIGLGYVAYVNILDKAANKKLSFNTRTFHAELSLELAKKHLLGIGLSPSLEEIERKNSDAYKKYRIESINTNHTLGVLFLFGPVFGILYLATLFFQDLLSQRKFLFWIIILLINFSEPLFFTVFFLIIFLSGYFNVCDLIIKSSRSINHSNFPA